MEGCGGPWGGPGGGGTPPWGGSRGGGTPPWGGQKGVKRGQKVANQGGTLGAPLFALGIPYRNGPWQAKKTVRGAKKGPFWGGPPPLGGVSRGAPPLRGGDFGAYRPVLGGGPPLGGGPRGVYRGGPPGASIWQEKCYQLGGNHATLSKFRPKI